MVTRRREILKSSAVSVSFGIAGFTHGVRGEPGSPDKADDEWPTEITLSFESVSPSEFDRSSVDYILYGNRSYREQKVLNKAIESTYRIRIGETGPAVNQIRAAIANRAGNNLRVYLNRDDEYFISHLVVGTHIVATPGQKPPSNEDER